MFSVFMILANKIHLPEGSTGKLKYSIGIGIKKADRHLHVSNDDRGKIFIELEKPDKNGWVKVVSELDKDFPDYLAMTEQEYRSPVKKRSFLIPALLGGFVFFWIADRGGLPPGRRS